jgi:hypothetical protein
MPKPRHNQTRRPDTDHSDDRVLRRLEADHPIDAIRQAVADTWERGWHPMDVARTFGVDDPLPLAVAVDAITLDRTQWHPRATPLWFDQADALGSTTPWWDSHQPYWSQLQGRHGSSAHHLMYAATVVMRLLANPPAQPMFEASPRSPGRLRAGADDAVLTKVRGLLAKAESTEFDHEAEALSAKAQELIARHAIDLALLAHEIDVPGGRRIYLDPPYAKAKFMLLTNIADANGCKSVWNDGRRTASLIGHQSDMHLSELLFTSLLLQGTGAVLKAGTQHDHSGVNTTRSWRNAFWQGYAHRIGQRLKEASRSVRAQRQDETGTDLLPVLARRSDAVDKALADAFPSLGSLRTSITNGEGLHAGRRFADQAELDAKRTVNGKGAPELTR